VKVSLAGGTSPRWSRSGEELYFISNVALPGLDTISVSRRIVVQR
jgi:hypothetical protein